MEQDPSNDSPLGSLIASADVNERRLSRARARHNRVRVHIADALALARKKSLTWRVLFAFACAALAYSIIGTGRDLFGAYIWVRDATQCVLGSSHYSTATSLCFDPKTSESLNITPEQRSAEINLDLRVFDERIGLALLGEYYSKEVRELAMYVSPYSIKPASSLGIQNPAEDLPSGIRSALTRLGDGYYSDTVEAVIVADIRTISGQAVTGLMPVTVSCRSLLSSSIVAYHLLHRAEWLTNCDDFKSRADITLISRNEGGAIVTTLKPPAVDSK